MYAKLREYKELDSNMTIDGVVETLEGDVESMQEMSREDTHGQGVREHYPSRPDYWQDDDGVWHSR